MQWVCKVSNFLLKKKGLDLMVYLQYILREDFKFDEIAILIYSHMYQLHIGVILHDKYWSTHSVQNMETFETSDIILAYFGEINFKDMVKQAITSETIELPLHLLANELPILTSRTKVPKKIAVACSDKEDQQDVDPENTSENENKICDKDQDANQLGYVSDHDDSVTEAYYSEDDEEPSAQTKANINLLELDINANIVK